MCLLPSPMASTAKDLIDDCLHANPSPIGCTIDSPIASAAHHPLAALWHRRRCHLTSPPNHSPSPVRLSPLSIPLTLEPRSPTLTTDPNPKGERLREFEIEE
uniref:Uncharacterized protein n=1 Tax=Arundo donax TaxID=35708 RepID=A0A0A9ACA3_ARUDO